MRAATGGDRRTGSARPGGRPRTHTGVPSGLCRSASRIFAARRTVGCLCPRLEQTRKGPMTAAQILMAMIASACFTGGAAGTAARTRARMYLAEPELMAMLRAPADHQNPEGIALRHLAETAGMEAMLPVLAPED